MRSVVRLTAILIDVAGAAAHVRYTLRCYKTQTTEQNERTAQPHYDLNTAAGVMSWGFFVRLFLTFWGRYTNDEDGWCCTYYSAAVTALTSMKKSPAVEGLRRQHTGCRDKQRICKSNPKQSNFSVKSSVWI